MLSDTDIIHAASEAGLCLPRCWALDRLNNEDDIHRNQQWIDEAPSSGERQQRQEIVDRELNSANDQLQKLKSFAATVLRMATHQVAPVSTNRRQTEIRFRLLDAADNLTSVPPANENTP